MHLDVRGLHAQEAPERGASIRLSEGRESGEKTGTK